MSLVVDLVGEKHAMGAEIARLTAAPGEAWERLGVERDTAWEAHAAVGAELAKARVETKEVYAELETVRAKNISAVGALVEIRETLGRAQTERDAARAEIARLTAVKSAEVAPIIERFQAAFGAATPEAPAFTAA